MSIFLILVISKSNTASFFAISVLFSILYVKYCAAAPISQESLQNLIKNVLRNILQIPEYIRQEKWPATQFLLSLPLMKTHLSVCCGAKMGVRCEFFVASPLAENDLLS